MNEPKPRDPTALSTRHRTTTTTTKAVLVLLTTVLSLLAYTLHATGTARLALILGNVENALHPEHYHGRHVGSSFFEGWYFKTVDPRTHTSIVFIPGIFRARGDSDSRIADHAFIMVFADALPETLYYRFGASEFHDERALNAGQLRIRIGTGNVFDESGIVASLDARRLVDVKEAEWDAYRAQIAHDLTRIIAEQAPIEETDALLSLLLKTLAPKPKASVNPRRLSVTGSLVFTETNPLPRTAYAPSVMGPFTYLPFLECNHGVVSMYHGVRGEVEFWDPEGEGGKELVEKFEVGEGVGEGYIEKDWGMYFPQSWIWIQSNSFGRSPGTGLMFMVCKCVRDTCTNPNPLPSSTQISIADIPLLDPNWQLTTLLTNTFPFLGSYLHFPGRLITLHLSDASALSSLASAFDTQSPPKNKTLLNFSTYTFARQHRLDITVHHGDPDSPPTPEMTDSSAPLVLTQRVHLMVSDRRERLFLEVTATRVIGGGVPLRAPGRDGKAMWLKVEETLDAVVRAKIWRRVEGTEEILWEDTGVAGGMEVVGDVVWLK
ncbi:hypothetical protein BC938DRAFT_473120, partial [Jimgerdemannia flammicorona]